MKIPHPKKSKSIHRKLLLTAILVMGVSSAQAVDPDQETVQTWLDRMAVAVNNLTYRGTLVYFRGPQVDALKIFHRVDDSGMKERLVALNGSPREVLRDNDSVRCIFPDSQSILVDTRIAERLFPMIPSDASGLTSGRYTFEFGGTDRIARMDAQIVNISPMDKFRYGYRLWLEKNTGMLLKSTLQDEQGRPLEQLMFTEIEIGATIPDRDLRPDIPGTGFVQVDIPNSVQSNEVTPVSEWQVTHIPEGFQLTSHRYGSRKSMEHLVFTDGLASVSVYVETSNGESPALSGHSRLGAVNMYGHSWKGFSITAVGEVPANTVKMMASSIQQSGLSGR